MRIVIDLQGAQGDSRFRGIGRYSLDLALGIARNRGDHEVIIALSDLFPDTINDLRSAFYGLLPASAVRVWTAPAPVCWVNQENSARRKQAELIRETFLATLDPDVVLITSLFDGFGDDVVASVGLVQNFLTAVILYDLIPLMNPEKYLSSQVASKWYAGTIDHLKRADKLLSISRSAATEAIDHLQMDVQKVSNISTAANVKFRPLEITELDARELRRKFGIEQKFLLNSGGFDIRKNIDALVRAFSRLPVACQNAHHLVISGKVSEEERARLNALAASAGLANDRLLLTGYVSDNELLMLYNHCQAFIMPSFHEGFGLPPLEAMQCGKAAIASNTTNLPEVIGREDALFDPKDEAAIARKIEEVLTNDAFRRELEIHGVKQAEKFSWDMSAQKAVTALEELLAQNKGPESPEANRAATMASESETPAPAQPNVVTGENLASPPEESRFPALYSEELRTYSDSAYSQPAACVQELLDILGSQPMSDYEMASLAEKLSRNFPPETRKPTLFIDVSELAQADAKTGIQRVVRAVLSSLLKTSDASHSFVPVRRNQKGQYVVAVGATKTVLGVDFGTMTETQVEPTVGDVFLGLDLDALCPPEACLELERMKRWGVKVFHVVYDLLPLQFPAYFDEGAQYWYPKWINRVCSDDGAICISKAVADDLTAWIAEAGPERKTPFQISWFHLGADVQNSNPSRGLPADANSLMSNLKARPTFLMVGTVEPRKGYRQAISAFEQLWSKGVDVNLVIVGKEGWNLVDLAKRMRLHPEKGSRLFWLESASDEYLEMIYGASNCLLAASEGEGFGLPLIEAAQHKLPVLVREIPVFREVADKHATYFSGGEPRDISEALERWLYEWKAGNHVRSDNMHWLTWDQSAAQLIGIVDQWSGQVHKIDMEHWTVST